MKRRLIICAALLALLTACGEKPMVIDGTIKGYDGGLLLVSATGDFSMDTLQVADDGTFHFEKFIDKACDGFICVQGKGSSWAVFIPGEEYRFDVDMTVTPSVWTYSGKNQDAMDFLGYYRGIYSSFTDPEGLDDFKKYSAYWADCEKNALDSLAKVSSRKARELFTDKIAINSAYKNLSWAWKLRKNNIPFESDQDFMAFFDNVDLSEEGMCKAMLSSMVNIKADIYDNTLEYSIRYLKAIDDLSPNLHVRDSVAAKYLESLFRDSKVGSEETAAFLLAKAEEVGVDEATLEVYRQKAEKALQLVAGHEAIDFEMIDAKGNAVRLSDFKGKAVYVDFWATWCIPCCMQIPYMEKVAAKYKGDSRVACISVSLDKKVEDWLEKLDEDKPAWPQYRTADAGKAVQTAYGFAAIPRFMLFDRNGQIVDIDAPRPQSFDEVCGMIDKILE